MLKYIRTDYGLLALVEDKEVFRVYLEQKRIEFVDVYTHNFTIEEVKQVCELMSMLGVCSNERTWCYNGSKDF